MLVVYVVWGASMAMIVCSKTLLWLAPVIGLLLYYMVQIGQAYVLLLAVTHGRRLRRADDNVNT